MTHRRFTAAAVQVCVQSDKLANLDKVESFTVEAARLEAKLVVFPEVFLWRGDRAEERGAAEPIPGPSTNRLCALARQLNIYIVAGSILELSDSERVFNTSLLIGPGGDLMAAYRKLHLFDVDIAEHVSIRESDTRRPGDRVVSAPTELGVIGLTICYDLRFPELYRRLTLGGAEIITVPSAFTFSTGAAHWEILLRARAIENQVYMIAPDQIGRGPGGFLDFGNSMIVDPWGTPLARAADRECLLLAEIDRDHQDRVRRELPSLRHIRLHDGLGGVPGSE